MGLRTRTRTDTDHWSTRRGDRFQIYANAHTGVVDVITWDVTGKSAAERIDRAPGGDAAEHAATLAERMAAQEAPRRAMWEAVAAMHMEGYGRQGQVHPVKGTYGYVLNHVDFAEPHRLGGTTPLQQCFFRAEALAHLIDLTRTGAIEGHRVLNATLQGRWVRGREVTWDYERRVMYKGELLGVREGWRRCHQDEPHGEPSRTW